MFKGSMTALVTPFRDGEIDEKAYRGLIEFQIGAGTDGLVPCGTTGESATLHRTRSTTASSRSASRPRPGACR